MPLMRLREITDALLEGGRLNGADWALITEMQTILMIGGNEPGTTRQSTGAMRQQRYRERNALRNGDVTPVTESPPKEISKPPLPQKPTVSTPKGKRLAEDWVPSENLLLSGAKLGLSAETLRFETDAFRDHFLSVSGPRANKIDWDRTWMNWMREAKRRVKAKSGVNVLAFKADLAPKRTWQEIKAERERNGT